MHPDPIGTWVAWFQLIFGGLYFIWGLRAKRSPGTQAFGPLGLWSILVGVFHLLGGYVPERILLALFVICFSAVGVWFVRVLRESKARTRALTKHP